MIKNLFINGCSFSEGNGICEELGLEIDSEKEKNEWSYGAHLSKLLNLYIQFRIFTIQLVI